MALLEFFVHDQSIAVPDTLVPPKLVGAWTLLLEFPPIGAANVNDEVANLKS